VNKAFGRGKHKIAPVATIADPDPGHSSPPFAAGFFSRARRTAHDMVQGFGGSDCSVCLEYIGVDEYTLLCGHKFHLDCIKRSSERTPSCPYCRNVEAVVHLREPVVDCSEMPVPCVACGPKSAKENMVFCTGRGCFDDKTNVFEWEVKAKCLPCFLPPGVTVENAPDFTCGDCSQLKHNKRRRR